jgi:hypothetical protein
MVNESFISMVETFVDANLVSAGAPRSIIDYVLLVVATATDTP